MTALYSVDDCESLTTKQVHGLYKDHVNKSQVSLMTSFGFGQELVGEVAAKPLARLVGLRPVHVGDGFGAHDVAYRRVDLGSKDEPRDVGRALGGVDGDGLDGVLV